MSPVSSTEELKEPHFISVLIDSSNHLDNKLVPLVVKYYHPEKVGTTRAEPVCGWIDNMQGLTGMVTAAYVGYMRRLHSDPKAVANIIPMDMTVNALIVSAWEVANKS
ncbi:hypothetical protein ANN_04963, partial [Periplaneta americana]